MPLPIEIQGYTTSTFRPREILLFTGSRIAVDTDSGTRWVKDHVCRVLRTLLPESALVTGDARSDIAAVEAAHSLGMRATIYTLDKMIVAWAAGEAPVQVGTWSPPPEFAGVRPFTPRWPLARNLALVKAVARALAQGIPAQGLALRAPWSPSHGTEQTRDRAREHGIPVTEVVATEPLRHDLAIDTRVVAEIHRLIDALPAHALAEPAVAAQLLAIQDMLLYSNACTTIEQ